MSTNKHAFLSASSAHRWARCEVAPWREKDIKDVDNLYAQEGTLAHEELEKCLKSGIKSGNEYINEVVDRIKIEADDGAIYSEQQLSIEFITTELGAKGTADVVIVKPKKLIVRDLKYGMGVRVEAEENEQLLIYGAAALDIFDVLGDIEEVTMAIDQPRLNHVSEWTISVNDVRKSIKILKTKAKRILTAQEKLIATPGEKQCKFCKAKANCPEYTDFVLNIIANDFVDLTKPEGFMQTVKIANEHIVHASDEHLATCLDAVDMIENWCKSVRSEVEKRLFSNTFSDTRYKLVQGKKGSRKWADEDKVVEFCLSNGLIEKEIYEYKLLTPPALEKNLKKEPIWQDLKEYIIQQEGKPSVAKASDKRPALDSTVEFEAIEYDESLIGLSK